MDTFDKQAYVDFLLASDIFTFSEEPIPIVSGSSHFKLDFGQITQDVWRSNTLQYFVQSYLRQQKIDPTQFYGIPEGMTAFGILLQNEWAKQSPNYEERSHQLLMGRAKPKRVGTYAERHFVGEPQDGVVIIEDATTSGTSIIEKGIKPLLESRTEIRGVVTLVDRLGTPNNQLTVEGKVKGYEIDYFAMATIRDILPQALKKYDPSKRIREAITSEYENLGRRDLIY